ncbi:MAG: hypothetical protein JWO84_460 [Parcubacteria group bacterium]|nr:hypothetical protein [Parcubacteria group bacterium]
MSKGIAFAVLAPLFYALANVLIEWKLVRYNNLSLMVVYAAIIAGVAFAIRLAARGADPAAYAFPAGMNLVWLIVLGVLFFVADYLYVGAYTSNVSLLTITTISVLFPVFASLIKLVGSRFLAGMTFTPPTPTLVIAYVLAATAVILVVKEGMKAA